MALKSLDATRHTDCCRGTSVGSRLRLQTHSIILLYKQKVKQLLHMVLPLLKQLADVVQPRDFNGKVNTVAMVNLNKKHSSLDASCSY